MKNVSTALKTHFASSMTTIAHIVKLTRRDGFILAVTLDHDRDLVFSGTTYKSAMGVTPSAAETSAAMNVDTMNVTGALLAGGMTEADIAAGLWDLCKVEVRRVNYMDLTQGAEWFRSGTLGEISHARTSFDVELRGMMQKLQQTLGDVVSPSCNADLFDARCGVVKTEGTNQFSGQVVTSITSQRQFSASALTQAADFFTAGKVTFTSGANAGLSMEIKQHAAAGAFTLQESMPYPIAVSDQFTVWAGCAKRSAEDCQTKFNNVTRFRGFPSLPGQDQMYKGV